MKKNAKKLTNEELKQKAKSYGLNIENLHRTYIIENIKWYEKYKAFSTQTQKKIERLVAQYERKQKIKIDNKEPVKFIAGTKYIREFQGKKYEVTAISDGYCYNGKVYKSLSAIANEITGTRWNGKRFFGVK